MLLIWAARAQTPVARAATHKAKFLMKQSSCRTNDDFRVADRVRLVPESQEWKADTRLQGKIGDTGLSLAAMGGLVPVLTTADF